MSILNWKNKVLGHTFQGGSSGGGGNSGGGGGAQQTNVTNTNIPEYARPYVETMLGTAQQQIFNYDSDGNVTSMKPYTPYSNNANDYIAGFSPLQQQAQSNIANMQVPGQYNTAMNYAQTAGLGAMGTANSAAQFGGMGANFGANAASLAPQAQQYGQNAADIGTTGGLGYGAAGMQAGRQGEMSGMMGQQAGMSYGQNATNANAVGAYMNPYLQATLNPSMQLQAQQFGQLNAQNQGQATQQGAFGGGRQAVMQGLNQQNQMLAQNQLVGNAYNQAYNTANQNMQAASQLGMQGAGLGIQGAQAGMQGAGVGLQGVNAAMQGQQAGLQGLGAANALYNTGISGANTGLQGTAAQQAAYQQLGAQGANLANIAGQQTQTALGINQAQEAAGAAQQAQQQNVINQQVQNYATGQQYPMMQLANMSNLLRGLPMQSATSQTYQAAPSAVSQLAGLGTAGVAGYKLATMKEGGIAKVKKFDVGGSVKHDLMQMAEADPKAFAEHMKVATSPEEKKIGYQVATEMGLTAAAPNIRMAGGGIVAFAEGGDTDLNEYEDSYAEDAEDRAFAQRDAYNNAMVEQLAGMPITNGASSIGIKSEVKGAPQPLGYKHTDEFKKKIEHLESRGRDYDEKGNILTSHKGAKGRMQTMPNTLRDPGFGVKPAQSEHPDELARVGRDYADAMLARYKDPKLAAMAYNWGPGNVDKYIAGGMKGPVPGETRQYASNFAAGGIAQVKRFGLPDSKDQLVASDDEPVSSIGSLFTPNKEQKAFAKNYLAQRAKQQEAQKALTDPSLDLPFYKAVKPSERTAIEAKRNALQTQLVPKATQPPTLAQPSNANQYPNISFTQDMEDQEANKPAVIPSEDKAAGKEAPKTDASGNDMAPANDFQKRLMDFMDKKEAGLTSQKQEDKWMSILAAGLGMMGGTSPWAGVNIGKGGQEGIASMLSANKQRGAEEAALGKLYSQGYQTNESALNRLAVAKERNLARGDTNQLNAYNAYQKNLGDIQGKREALFTKEMSSGSNSMLNARLEALNQKLIKDPSDAKAKAEYNSLMEQKNAIRNRIYSSIKDPSPPPGLNLGTGSASNVIKLD